MTLGKSILGRLLVIDDDVDLLELMRDYYRPRGYRVETIHSALEALEKFRKKPSDLSMYDVIISDLKMPDCDGMEFIREMKTVSPSTPIILMTAHSSVELAVNAVKEGAYDFVNKPLNFANMSVSIERALSLKKIQIENEALRGAVSATKSFSGMISRSPAMAAVIEFTRRAADSAANILITGESGTGKEIIAKAIHHNSPRRNQPFIAINCSAIPENLLESELFGHAKGSFTGAQDRKIGLFEEANGGTLFLDEIGDLSLPLQAKLLRVIQERKIKRIGENQYRDIDVRILAATHKNLELEVQEQRFRQDLFFRLNVIRIHIPPLRERREDILTLADLFLRKFAAQNSSRVHGITRQAQEHLYQRDWPGNVRELENAIERAVILCQRDVLDLEDLPQLIVTGAPIPQDVPPPLMTIPAPVAAPAPASVPAPPPIAPPLPRASYPPPLYAMQAPESLPLFYQLQNLDWQELPTLSDLNLDYIQFVMKRVGGVRERAARTLGIDRKTLYRKLDEIDKKTSPREEGPSLRS